VGTTNQVEQPKAWVNANSQWRQISLKPTGTILHHLTSGIKNIASEESHDPSKQDEVVRYKSLGNYTY
jgi:hypothetical protein